MSNLNFSTMTISPMGLDIVESIHLTVPFEDWSRVRSPSRAIRRLRRGFRQNIVHLQLPDPKAYEIGGKIVMHPATAKRLRDEIGKRMQDDIERDFLAAARGELKL